MCGICGFYSHSQFSSQDELRNMANSLNHRGPDADGFLCNQTVGLAHKRLSILDLSEHANQPMESHSQRYTIVFNGEIYNYKDIAKELNTNFKTNSDTEVILEAFEAWGTGFVTKLNGMFSIAIYDKLEEKLYLFRDRLGIKPLYYFYDNQNFAFASELKALLQITNIKASLEINHTAISEFLHLGYIPEPNSIYKNIWKFTAGHFGVLSEKNLEIKPYWSIKENIKTETINDYHTAKAELKSLIEASVSARLISDVPFGSFLSGGIDSSLVTAVAQKHTNGKLNTFSIGFNEVKYNEANHAREVAKHLGTNHHEMMVSQTDAKKLIPELLDYYDEPYADSSAIPTMLLSQFTKKHVTVALSGDGGDELFHGYGSYEWAKRLSSPWIQGIRKPLSQGLSQINKYKHRSEILKYHKKEHLKSHIFSQEQFFFSRKEINELLENKNNSDFNLFEDYRHFSRKLNAREEQAIFDLHYYLKDDLLTKVDRASMRYSLEARVPLLDHNIVVFALNLSPELKVNQKIKKYLLKEVLYDYVPKTYFDRPKWGFSIPLKQWLKDDLRFLIDTFLSKETIEKHHIVKFEYVQKLKTQYFNGSDYLYNRLWVLIILHQFLENKTKLLLKF